MAFGSVQISYDALGERRFAQTVRVPAYGGERVWLNRHITFIVAEKA